MKQYTELVEDESLELVSVFTKYIQKNRGKVDQIICNGDDYLIIYTAKSELDFGYLHSCYLEENASLNLN